MSPGLRVDHVALRSGFAFGALLRTLNFVPAFTLQFHQGGVLLPELGLWLDSRWPRTGPEKVFISHAHSDHVAEHREVILSAPTARLMQARVPGKRLEHILGFNEARPFNGSALPYQLTLVPAGHIFGSSMARIEVDGTSILYTGDFKLRPGLSAECCAPCKADILIMETTYGLPHYCFPPTEDVLRSVIRFCREALDNDETPVLLGYSLGKSQEILCGLAEAGLPLALHGTAFKLTEVYRELGRTLPPYEPYDRQTAAGKVLICPPSVVGSAMLRGLGRVRTAVLTGWAVDPNCRYRYGVDAAFPLSDHADFPQLLELVRCVSPKIVYTLHGYASEFAQTLRDMGIEAWALGETEQMALSLPRSPRRKEGDTPGHHESPSLRRGVQPEATPLQSMESDPALFVHFSRTCAAIAATASKLEKTARLANYLQVLPEANLASVAVWFTGLPFASAENKALQLGWALLRDALCDVASVTEDDLYQIYLRHSDLGETAHELYESRSPRRKEGDSALTLSAVQEAFNALLAARGPGAKLPILIRVLRACSPIEAKFLVKIITSDLRIGLKEGLVEEAIAQAFSVPADAARQANLLLGHIGETAVLAKRNALDQATLVPFRPVKFMLASPEETAASIWERIQSSSASERGQPTPHPVWIEDKYDGIRCQLHKVDARVELYSRDLKTLARTFFEIADAAKAISSDVILDGELLGMRNGVALPFAELQKRLGRREPDLFLGEEVPVAYVAFDLLWRDGETFLNRPLSERRRALEALGLQRKFCVASITQANSADEIEATFTAARGRNNEGLMVKDPASLYTPGRRGLAWLKLKKAFATLDCVVVGAEYGHGKRKDVLSDYTFAVRDGNSGELKTIGKAYTGLTDTEIGDLTQHFLSTAIRQHGRYFEVEPQIVLEIAFDRIQPSDRHNSGLALRFPRIVRIRTDKTPAEIDTLATARKLAASAR
jgi:DNA ligase-1